MSNARTPIRRYGTLALRPLGALVVAAILLALLVDRIFFESSTTPAGTGSGIAATQTRSLPPFARVELAGANNVVVRVGARQSVVVHADSNLLGRVTTRVRSSRLAIGTTPGNLSAKTPMFVVVNMPAIDGVKLQGAGNISVTGINGESLTVELPGSGNIDAAGSTTKLDVTLGGDGNALLHQLVARDANAALSGEGTIMLTATHRLAARLSGTGAILYRGNPEHLSQSITGTGTIGAG